MTALTANIASCDITVLGRRFHALSDPTRLAILRALRDGECCVCDLQGALVAAQSRLSFHLRVLKETGLVTDRKDGRWSWYQLVPEALDSLQGAINELTAPFPAPGRHSLPLLSPDAVQADGCCG